MSQFIPSFHYEISSDKLTDEWCKKAVNYAYTNGQMKSLLSGKNVQEIVTFAEGNFDLTFARKITNSYRKQIKNANGGKISKEVFDRLDKTGVPYEQINVITPILNTAISVIDQRPVEITFTCQDPLAFKKKKEDLDLLRNSVKIQQEMQPIYDELEIGDFQPFATKNTAVPYTVLPFNLDVEKEEEFEYFANFILNISEEAAFESICSQLYENLKVKQIKYLETKDQYLFGISANDTYIDNLTSLPSTKYIHPDRVFTTKSQLPDFSDRTEQYIPHDITPNQLLSSFASEINGTEDLANLLNAYGNKINTKFDRANWETQHLSLLEFQIRTSDYIGVGEKVGKYGSYKYFTNEPDKIKSKIWAQNTIRFYWLAGTDRFFNKERLGFAYRSKANPTYCNFTTNIYKSAERSPVENSIIEAKSVQIATIKFLHELVAAAPSGKSIDWGAIENFLDSVKDADLGLTASEVLDMAIERNLVLYTTENFESQKAANYNPVRDIQGGTKDSLNGYFIVIQNAKTNIKAHFGLNDAIMGQNNNPDTLIGWEKIRINMATNAQSHVANAITSQYQNMFFVMSAYVKECIEMGGAVREAIENLIGSNKTDLIDRMSDDISKHNPIPKIDLGLRVEERELFKSELIKLRQAGVINAAEEFFIFKMTNTKDAVLLLSIKEEKFKREQREAQERLNQIQIQREQEVGKNMQMQTQLQAQADQQKLQIKAQADANIKTLLAQLTKDTAAQEALMKRITQKERIADSRDAKIAQMKVKKELDNQTATF